MWQAMLFEPVFFSVNYKMKKGCHACRIEKPLDNIFLHLHWDKKNKTSPTPELLSLLAKPWRKANTSNSFVLVRNAWWYPFSSL